MSIFSPPLGTVPRIELNDLMVGTFCIARACVIQDLGFTFLPFFL